MRVCSRSAVLLLVAFAALIFRSIPSFAEIRTLEGIVVKVADGDTLTVLDSNKDPHRVRIAGIDAPEKNQPFGNASKKRLGDLVALKEVRAEFTKYDRYGRIAGKVLVKPLDYPTRGKTLDVGLVQITRGVPSTLERPGRIRGNPPAFRLLLLSCHQVYTRGEYNSRQ